MSINLINYALAKKDWDKAYEDLKVLEIGGRNLISYSTVGEYRDRAGSVSSTTKLSIDGTKITVNSKLSDLIGFKVEDVSNLTVLTLSFYSDLDNAKVYYKFDNSTQTSMSVTLKGDRFETQIYVPSGATSLTIGVGRYPHPDIFESYYVDKVKLEIGNKATPWTPAPEDINAHPFVVKLAELSYKVNSQ